MKDPGRRRPPVGTVVLNCSVVANLLVVIITSVKEVMFFVHFCLFVCLLTGLLTNYLTNPYVIFWNGWT